MKLDLSRRFLVVFTIIGLAALTSGYILIHSAQQRLSDGNVINLAGAQRMLSQKISKEALLVVGVDGGASPEKMMASVSRYRRVLRGLRHGDKALGIPPTRDPEILQAITVVEKSWGPFAAAVERLSNERDPEAARRAAAVIAATNESLLAQSDRVVKMLENAASSKARSNVRTQYVILAGLQILLALLWLFQVRPLNQKLLQVIGRIEQVSQKVFQVGRGMKIVSQEMAGSAAKEAQEIEVSVTKVASAARSIREKVEQTEEIRHALAQIVEVLETTRVAVEELNNNFAHLRSLTASAQNASGLIQRLSQEVNLVALNASIEAARSGEASRAFSAVAKQMGILAQRSTETAKETTALLEQLAESVAAGSISAGQTAEASVALVTRQEHLADRVRLLVDATNEQAHQVGDISSQLGEVKHHGSETSRLASEVSAEAGRLSDEVGGVRSVLVTLANIVGVTSAAIYETHEPVHQQGDRTSATLQSQTYPAFLHRAIVRTDP
jgi:methyl-accepting chemotaxis protein